MHTGTIVCHVCTCCTPVARQYAPAHAHVCARTLAQAREFLLDDFMNGFLYKLYADKWNPLKYIFWFRLLLLATYVILLSCIASPSIVLVGTLWGTGASPRFMRPMVIVEIVLMVPVALLEIVETSIDFFYNEDSVALKARLRLWGRGKRALIKFIDRGGHLVLSSVSLVLTGCSVSSS